MDTLTKIIPTPEAMASEAQAFIEALAVETEGATLVTLSGELGAGKTTFTQAVASALGVGDVVNSPTFVIEKVYNIPEGQKFQRLIHIDAYRLTNNGELTALGFGEIMSHPGNLILLEWPENVAGISDHAAVKILWSRWMMARDKLRMPKAAAKKPAAKKEVRKRLVLLDAHAIIIAPITRFLTSRRRMASHPALCTGSPRCFFASFKI